ncbi:MAG: hypothetical protein CMO80_11715 [Verrucomicrobiales bacterium]|nr:hypothetical protein [Verrucomicrobiales bacterium]
MSFAQPYLLWLFVLVPALIVFLVWAWRKKQWLIEQFVNSRLQGSLTVGITRSRQKAKIALIVGSVCLIIFAAARPQWGFEWDEAKQRGLDIIVAIDVSRSMDAKDVKPTRLERAKLAAMDLLALAKTDRVGLVVFSGSAFLQCPLTLDDAGFSQSVRSLHTGIMNEPGTAVDLAIDTALGAFEEENENYKILVIFTDGEITEAGAMEAAEAATDSDMRIFTVGVGTPAGEMIEVSKGGKSGFLKDKEGNVVRSRLDEPMLRAIATAADGFYLNLSGAAAVETLYARGLAPLPKAEVSSRLVRVKFERFYWPLSVAIVLLMIEMFISDQRRSRRRKKPATAVAVLLVVLLTPSAQAAPSASAAMKQYRNGDYVAALDQYQALRKRSPEDARIDFNAGAAAYRAKDYESAARLFSTALASEDEALAQSAWYNLANTFYQMGDAEDDPQKRLETWKNAVDLYDNAIRSKPEDKDALHNRDFVNYMVKKLEEQMPEDQEGEDGDPNDEENEGEDQQDDQKKDDQNDQKNQDDQQQENDENKDGQDENKEEDQKDQSSEGDEEKQDEEQQSDQNKEGDEEKKQPQPQPGDKDDQEQPKPQPGEMRKMSKEEALRLLMSQMSRSKMMIFAPPAPKEDGKKRKKSGKLW